MTMAERLLISEDEKVCCNCKYFEQHYVLNKELNKIFLCTAGYFIKAHISH